jgi:hypothetical protein
VGQQQCLAAHASRSQSGLTSGMAATNDNHVEKFWVKHGESKWGTVQNAQRERLVGQPLILPVAKN